MAQLRWQHELGCRSQQAISQVKAVVQELRRSGAFHAAPPALLQLALRHTAYWRHANVDSNAVPIQASLTIHTERDLMQCSDVQPQRSFIMHRHVPESISPPLTPEV